MGAIALSGGWLCLPTKQSWRGGLYAAVGHSHLHRNSNPLAAADEVTFVGNCLQGQQGSSAHNGAAAAFLLSNCAG